jgi:protein-L-isoaspartate(D-aspartate) O-methyltransferase
METIKTKHLQWLNAVLKSTIKKYACRNTGIFFLVFMIFLHGFAMPIAHAQNFETERNQMIQTQIVARGIQDPAVIEAMKNVPRHHFVTEKFASLAYSDQPLPIGHKQTISQPFMVAYMSEALNVEPGDKVLEVGTGSGYQAAILAEMDVNVWSIEIIPELALQAKENLQNVGYNSVVVKQGDGYKGWPEEAPFDGIIVTAAPPSIPEALVEQLKTDGIMIVPVGRQNTVQTLKKITKTEDGISQTELIPVRFVPMVK